MLCCAGQADEDTIPAIEAVNGRKGWIDAHAQLAYKYILVADGNGLAPRFKNALAVGMPILTDMRHRNGCTILWPATNALNPQQGEARQDKACAQRIC